MVSTVLGRSRQARRVWSSEGGRVLVARLVVRLVRGVIPTTGRDLPVRKSDLLAANDVQATNGGARVVQHDTPLVINWVITPPSRGSGGHTTIFRVIELLEQRGHLNRLYIYDRYSGDLAAHASAVRRLFPRVRAEVNDATRAMDPCDAMFATAWPTAYVVRNSPLETRRLYFVQDFEPYFYPASTESVLAEDTYRFGFHGVTIGSWLAEKLASEYGMKCAYFEFGCDTSKYFVTDSMSRSGVVFHARSKVHRRGFELGVLALELLASWHPRTEIHVFGEDISNLPFRFHGHGVIAPKDLNKLYNTCVAGLSLSLTNISLIPLELLGAGCIPVVNDAPHNRSTIDNPYIRYARPTPQGLAETLSDVLTSPNVAEHAAKAAASVQDATWDQAGVVVERVLRELCSTAPPGTLKSPERVRV